MSICGNWQKYKNRNPLQRLLINRFLDTVAELVVPLRVTTVLDAGSGEGFVSQRVLGVVPHARITAVDLDLQALERGRKHHSDITFTFGDIIDLPFGDNSFDLVLCTEVLEHLDRPERALAELCRVSRRYCLISVPREPLFCLMNLARGKNISRLGSDADHRNLWTPRQFRRFAARQLDLVESRYPLPWQVYVARCLALGFRRVPQEEWEWSIAQRRSIR